MIRRASVEDADKIVEWTKRDFGEVCDFSGFFAKSENVCLIEGEGGAFFVQAEPGIYEVHVAFEQRGKEVIRLSHEMLRIMREEHGAKRFQAVVPIGARHVRMFTRLMGWKSQGIADLPCGTCELFIGE